MKFRSLRADEVDCRIQSVRQNGLSLLLYKDARCDQNILDETVGPLNWQRSHSRDNANCTVSIWDADKKMWVSKEDTGTESNTEKEKGLASDSFKRACFNWGIGRELYTAPFIWIKPDQCNIKTANGKYVCCDRFAVTQMEVENGKIVTLKILNQRTKETVFEKRPQSLSKNDDEKNEAMMSEAAGSKIDRNKWTALVKTANKKGVMYQTILLQYGLKNGSEMTVDIWMKAMKSLESMRDINE